MKKSALTALLAALIFGGSPDAARAALAKSSLEPAACVSANFSEKETGVHRKREKGKSWWSGFFPKGFLWNKKKEERRTKAVQVFRFAKWEKKRLEQPVQGGGRQHLILCLLSLVASIVFFALNRYAVAFNILGSVFAIAAAVFFVLWLLEFTRT